MTAQTAYDKFMAQALKYGFSLFGTVKTGQVTSYRTGDDGALEKGYPKTGARFTDNGDGTITDNATGLMWVKQPENIGGIWADAGQPERMSWNDAIDNCLALDYAGHDDWRLPNARELCSIVSLGTANPSIDGTFFPNTKAYSYWTSSTVETSVSNKWRILFTFGLAFYNHLDEEYYARPVRLGTPSD